MFGSVTRSRRKGDEDVPSFMSISISTNSSVGATSYVRAATATKAAAAVASVTEADGDSSKVSGPAAMMNKLKALQKSDPAKFKEAVNAVSRKLSEEAESASDEKQKSMLTDLAKKFESAGQSGDLPALQPAQGAAGAKGGDGGRPPGGGGGPPPGGGGGVKGASSSSSSSSSSTEPADANGDGTVTQAEQLAYDRKQEVKTSPAASETKRAAQAYKRIQGDDASEGAKRTMDSISSVVDRYAA